MEAQQNGTVTRSRRKVIDTTKISQHLITKKPLKRRRASKILRRAYDRNRTRASDISVSSVSGNDQSISYDPSKTTNVHVQINSNNLDSSENISLKRTKHHQNSIISNEQRLNASLRDEFFDQISSKTDSVASTNHTEISMAIDSEHSNEINLCLCGRKIELEKGDTAVLSKLNEILERMSETEKNTAKIDVRLRHLAQKIDQIESGDIEKEGAVGLDFTTLGLPIKTHESLQKLESDLKSSEFRQKMVTYLITKFINSFIDFCCTYCTVGCSQEDWWL